MLEEFSIDVLDNCQKKLVLGIDSFRKGKA
jgi:hypothetical protein